MDTLKYIKKLIKEYPNDADLGSQVRYYALKHVVCCDNFDNLCTTKEFDTHPYGWDVEQTKCKVCGRIIDTKIDK